MGVNIVVFIKRLFFVIIVFFSKFNDVKSHSNHIDLNSIQFEQIKRDVFLQNDFDFPTLINDLHENLSQVCSDEMNVIKNGLENSSVWALQLVGSWGKLPSNVSIADSYDFGEFSQCLNIRRHEKRYETQYCIGQLVIGMDAERMSGFMIPNHKKIVKTTWFLPRPTNGIAVNFGICLPKTCPLNVIESILNHLIQRNVTDVSVKLAGHTCQFEEIFSDVGTIDVIAIAFFGTILCLILASTCYDILCTLNNRGKNKTYLAFSFYSNGLKLLSYQKQESPDTISCLHGIRGISAFLIVYYHSVGMYRRFPMQNQSAYFPFMTRFHMLLYSGLLGVESFFVLSGLLLSMSLLKKFQKNGRIDIFSLYCHRYIRLTPLLGAFVLLNSSLFRFLGSGPLWHRMANEDRVKCEQLWWTNLLYVQNFIRSSAMCTPISWYLAVDMQLFLIAPAIIYLIYRFKAKTIYALLALVLGCIVITLSIHLEYGITSVERHYDILYNPTYVRYSPWLIGIINGYILLKTQNKQVHIPKMVNLLAWAFSLILLSAATLLNYPLSQPDAKFTPLAYGLFDGCSRVMWSIGLCYIIFACVHNYGGPVNWFLAHPFWQPISKLSYSIYLAHFTVIQNIFWMKTPAYFSEMAAFYGFIVNLLLTIVMSVVTALAFEFPMPTIEKLIFRKPPSTKPKPADAHNENNTELLLREAGATA